MDLAQNLGNMTFKGAAEHRERVSKEYLFLSKTSLEDNLSISLYYIERFFLVQNLKKDKKG